MKNVVRNGEFMKKTPQQESQYQSPSFQKIYLPNFLQLSAQSETTLQFNDGNTGSIPNIMTQENNGQTTGAFVNS
jgi:hypothetical protein